MTKQPPKIRQLVDALLLLGPMTYDKLTKVTGISEESAASMLRAAMSYDKYGLYVYATAPSKNRNVVKNVMAVDIEKYNQYMKRFKQRTAPAQKPKPRPKPKPKPVYTINIPDTKYKTIWQPSSPYQ